MNGRWRRGKMWGKEEDVMNYSINEWITWKKAELIGAGETRKDWMSYKAE